MDLSKIAVFGVGKFQAPHVGHKLMVDTILRHSDESNGEPFLFTTEKHNKLDDPKKLQRLQNKDPGQKDHPTFQGFVNFKGLNDTPLRPDAKVEILHKLFDHTGLHILSLPNMFDIPLKLKADGFNSVIFVAGSDRLKTENDKEAWKESYRKSFIPHMETILGTKNVTVIQAGDERGDESAEGAPSGKNVRKYAVEMGNMLISHEKRDQAFANLRKLIDPEKRITDEELIKYAELMRGNMNRGGTRKRRRRYKRKTRRRKYKKTKSNNRRSRHKVSKRKY